MNKKSTNDSGTCQGAIPSELLDELLKGYSKPEDLTGPDGLLKQLTAALVNRAMSAELEEGAPRATPPRL